MSGIAEIDPLLSGAIDEEGLIDARYRPVRLLGSGGMGWVFYAEDTQLGDTSVAVKILYPHLLGDRQNIARFRREAALSMRLSHPGIVQTHRLGLIGSYSCYIVMEFVAGPTLRQVIAERAGKPREFSQCELEFTGVIDAIAYAHDVGVIHRDLKPENILQLPDGGTKVADFGLAQSVSNEGRMTRIGDVLGTPLYMSPEQFRGEVADPRSDVYSFGILAFELVCGSVPYAGRSLVELAEQHCTAELPRPSVIRPDLPIWFDELFMRCAAKAPNERFASMAELRQWIVPHRAWEHSNVTHPVVSAELGPQVSQASLYRKKIERIAVRLISALLLVWTVPLTAHVSSRHPSPLIQNDNVVNEFFSRIFHRLEQLSGWQFKPMRKIYGIDVSISEPREFCHLRGGRRVLRPLLDVGVSPNFVCQEEGLSLLQFWSKALENDPAAENVQLLLARGADVSLVGADSSTPLELAIEHGHQAAAQALVAARADLEVPFRSGELALHRAISLNQVAVVATMLERGVSPDRLSSALLVAVRSRNLEAAQLLLKRGADPTAQDANGVSSIDRLQALERTPGEEQLLEQMRQKQ